MTKRTKTTRQSSRGFPRDVVRPVGMVTQVSSHAPRLESTINPCLLEAMRARLEGEKRGERNGFRLGLYVGWVSMSAAVWVLMIVGVL